MNSATHLIKVVDLIRGLCFPEIEIQNNLLFISDHYVIQMNGKAKIIDILFDTTAFQLLDDLVQKTVLDVLWILLRRSIYDVVRFQCPLKSSLASALLSIIVSQPPILIAKRCIRLLSCVCSWQIVPSEIKQILKFLTEPSLLSMSFLQALRRMSSFDSDKEKATPNVFFNFGGTNSGLFIQSAPSCQLKEYEIVFWFRIESMKAASSHLVSLNSGVLGLDVYIEDSLLCISISTSATESTIIKCHEFSLAKGIWYSFVLKHSKPRISIFAKDELTVLLDNIIICQSSTKFPFTSSSSFMLSGMIGKDFDGQIGPVYIFNEIVPSSITEFLFKISAGKHVDSFSNTSQVDLLNTLAISQNEKKINLFSKLLSSFHPLRHDAHQNLVIDLHGGRHAQLGKQTFCTTITTLRESIISVGGISCLLPLFPKLLIDNEHLRNEIMKACPVDPVNSKKGGPGTKGFPNVGLGVSLVEVLFDFDQNLSFSSKTLMEIERDHLIEFAEDGPISLLLSILARCVKQSKINKLELLRIGGISMIEYVLTNLASSSTILKEESENCILSLLQLRSSAQDIPQLEASISSKLFCNFQIWSTASINLQSSLFSVLLANVKAQPDVFLVNGGVQPFIDCILSHYTSFDKSPIRYPEKGNEDYSQNSDKEMGMSNNENEESRLCLDGAMAGPNNFSHSFKNKLNRRMSASESSFENMNSPSPNTLRDKLKRGVSRNISCKFDNVSSKSLNSEFTSLDLFSQNSKVEGNSDCDIPLSLQNNLTLEEKRNIRSIIESIIMTLVMKDISELQIRPIVHFLTQCIDEVVLNEFVQLLLCLIVGEEGRRVVVVLTEICNGPEEFASFILSRIMDCEVEYLRCAAMLLLTHYYMRLDAVPINTLSNGTRKKKTSNVSRLRSVGFSKDISGMDRFAACGGLTFMGKILMDKKSSCAEATYHTLLEMLLCTSSTQSQIAIFYKNVFTEESVKIPLAKSHVSVETTANSLLAPILSTYENIIDGTREMTNPVVLSLLFYFLPQLPMFVQEKAYGDLLSLLKQNPSNRDYFCNNPLWHTCLFDLVGQLIVITESCNTVTMQSQIANHLRSWAQEACDDEDMISKLFSAVEVDPPANDSNLHKELDQLLLRTNSLYIPAMSPFFLEENRRRSLACKNSGALDMWFDVGMKVYAMLLTHSLDRNGGWKEIDKTISQSYDSNHGVAVSLAIFSHLLNDLTFSMQSRYKDIQRLAKSTNEDENKQASAHLENILSMIITISSFLMEMNSMAALGLQDIHSFKSRQNKFDNAPKCRFQCSDVNHKVCIIANDLCPDCQHSLSVHPVKERKEHLPIEILMQELEMKYNLNDIALDLVNHGDATTSGNLMQSQKQHIERNHAWIKVRNDEIQPSNIRQRSASARRLDEEKLGPLCRGYELPVGKMIVILQLLRFFDLIFWPSQRVRNSHLWSIRKDAINSSSSIKFETQPTLYSSIVRLSLYVMNRLSPFTDLAELNFRRLGDLMRYSDRIPVNSVPIDDLILVVVAHTIMALNRLRSSLIPIYKILNIDIENDVATNPVDSNNIQRELQQLEDSDEEMYRSIENPEFLFKLNCIFNNPAGKQLLSYLNSAISLLSVVYKIKKDLLSTIMGDRAFLSFTLLIQKYINHQLKRETSVPSHSLRTCDVQANFVDKPKSEKLSILIDPIINDDPEGCDPMSHDIFGVDADFCHEAAMRLCWLRNPFIHVNILHNESTVRSILVVDSFERDCNKYFYSDLISLKESLEELRFDTSQAADIEISDLKELASETILNITTREQLRQLSLVSSKELMNKSSAMLWHNCLKTFEMDWSPWGDKSPRELSFISLHKDSIMRCILLMKLDDPIDHSSAAYLDGKFRDQQEFLEPSLGSSTLTSNPTQNSFIQNAIKSFRPKLSRLQSVGNWDDDLNMELDAEEQSIDVTKQERTTLNMFLFQGSSKLPVWALQFNWLNDEREVYTTDAMQITREQVLTGTVLLSNKYLYYHPKRRLGGFTILPEAFKNRRYRLDRLVECLGRRYLLQNCGVELFFSEESEIFLAFNSSQELHKFMRYLRKQHLPMLVTTALNPAVVFQNSPWTELWRRRYISNFEYLMHLNRVAGRSYNDITQYPIMPWVLADYESSELDLLKQTTFRDLSKPIGALNDQRLVEILERYRTFDESEVPKFMYGSHYSSAGVVLHYLIRQEPFTSMAITLQGGRFDCPDRLFFDIRQSWHGVNYSVSDVKELVPELYSTPEIFLNTNNLPLGELQDDRGIVCDVLLPKWAKGSAFEFVRLHREALESEYVSAHLHEWIDLIFGYKQTGQAAVEAKNVFHYLTYENAVDINSIEDQLQKEATKAQVTHFGQTPSQLLTKEHPKRFPKEDCIIPFCNEPVKENFKRAKVYRLPKPSDRGEKGAVVFATAHSDRIYVMFEDFTLCSYRMYISAENECLPLLLKFEKARVLPSSLFSIFPAFKEIGQIIPESMNLFGNLVNSFLGSSCNEAAQTSTTKYSTLTSDHYHSTFSFKNICMIMIDSSNERIVTCGYWDNTIKVHSVDNMKEIEASTGNHIGQINCIDAGIRNSIVVSGGADGTCRVWVLESPALAASLTDGLWQYSEKRHSPADDVESFICVHTLWGHDRPISAICYSEYHDLVISGSESGLITIHSAFKGRYIRSIKKLLGQNISLIAVSSLGYIICCCHRDDIDDNSCFSNVSVFWINGEFLCNFDMNNRVRCMKLTSNGNVIFLGGDNGISIRSVWNLEELHNLDSTECGGPVTYLNLILGKSRYALVAQRLIFIDDHFLLIGSSTGEFSVLMDPVMKGKMLQQMKLP